MTAACDSPIAIRLRGPVSDNRSWWTCICGCSGRSRSGTGRRTRKIGGDQGADAPRAARAPRRPRRVGRRHRRRPVGRRPAAVGRQGHPGARDPAAQGARYAPGVPIEIDRVGDGYRLRMPPGAIDVTLVEEPGPRRRTWQPPPASSTRPPRALPAPRRCGVARAWPTSATSRSPCPTPSGSTSCRWQLLEDRLDVDLRRGRHDAVLADLEAACAEPSPARAAVGTADARPPPGRVARPRPSAPTRRSAT